MSIEIEHRKFTLSFRQTKGNETPFCAGAESNDSDLATVPPACPACGASWIEVPALQGEDAAASSNGIALAFQLRGLHVYASSAGGLRICSKPFEEFKEDR